VPDPALPPLRPHPALSQDLALPIRFLDDHLVVVAKPAGMATHPGPGWWRGSCVNALLHSIQDWPGIKGVAGPGVVHRLDRDTSGLLVFARSQRAHRPLLDAVAAHQFRRVYLACVEGEWSEPKTVSAPLGRDDTDSHRVVVRSDGKAACSHFHPVAWEIGRTWLHVTLETGRTHQIRVHAAHSGHPVVGDSVYGQAGPGMALHAWQLAFSHPVTGAWLSFEEPPPDTWEAWGLLPPVRVLERL